ncbi:response regulator [Myxococcaceae bacterium GXIMD 01537]
MQTGLVLNILLVEDNDDIREGLAALLEGEGYRVLEARTAEDGLAMLRQGAIHLLVTDFMLPARSGGWMLEEAARENLLRGAGVLMITAHPTVKAPPGAHMLQKPLDIDDFLRAVARLVTPAPAAQAL